MLTLLKISKFKRLILIFYFSTEQLEDSVDKLLEKF
jgi:hypothetical protein